MFSGIHSNCPFTSPFLKNVIRRQKPKELQFQIYTKRLFTAFSRQLMLQKGLVKAGERQRPRDIESNMRLHGRATKERNMNLNQLRCDRDPEQMDADVRRRKILLLLRCKDGNQQ